jgi:hypothetical protein
VACPPTCELSYRCTKCELPTPCGSQPGFCTRARLSFSPRASEEGYGQGALVLNQRGHVGSEAAWMLGVLRHVSCGHALHDGFPLSHPRHLRFDSEPGV